MSNIFQWFTVELLNVHTFSARNAGVRGNFALRNFAKFRMWHNYGLFKGGLMLFFMQLPLRRKVNTEGPHSLSRVSEHSVSKSKLQG
jgi:hypothetical protein